MVNYGVEKESKELLRLAELEKQEYLKYKSLQNPRGHTYNFN